MRVPPHLVGEMPTRRSIVATRSSRSLPVARPFARSGSPTICSTFIRGLSDVNGSWKIIRISRRTGAGRASPGSSTSTGRRGSVDGCCPKAAVESEQASAERRLAAAGLADEPERLAVHDVEVDVAEHVHHRVTGPPPFARREAHVRSRISMRLRISRRLPHDVIAPARRQVEARHHRNSVPAGAACRRARGAWKMSSTGPVSTTVPMYITTTSSAISATTPRSWVMNSIAHPVLGLQVAQQIEDPGLRGHVERGGGFVGDQHARLGGQCDRDHRALAHAAGQLERVGVHPLLGPRDTDPAQQSSSPRSHASCAGHRRGAAGSPRRAGRRSCTSATARPSAPGRPSRSRRRGSAASPRTSAAGRRGRSARSSAPRARGCGPRRSCRASRPGPRIERAVTDLPEPDSPTMQTVRPGSTSKLTPSTDRTTRSSSSKWSADPRRSSSGSVIASVPIACRDRRRRAARRQRSSATGPRPPRRRRASRSQGAVATARTFCASCSRTPQLIDGGCSPRPRKLSGGLGQDHAPGSPA